MFHFSVRFIGLCVACGLAAVAAPAQVVVVPTAPQIGSSNPVTAEPLVSRPSTRPCVVPLLNEAQFEGFNGIPIAYTPPAACPGPWAKVVLTADLTVTAGRQFDRTAEFILGGANIFYGTTSEPRSALSPSWHVERDVTDLSAIFKKPQTGVAEIGNVVDSTYTGIIYANAALAFYPANLFNPPAIVPDIVVPVNGSGGDAGSVNSGQQITQALNLPANVEKVYLDVISQSQSNDEFWYLCVPNDQTSNLESCGNTAFRETEITLDGKPAGVAPVYPWIYTGGIDPYLWEPITGVQTLDFKPYRVDLTPFAGVLADGGTHTVGIGVYNADSYFLVTGNMLVYTDPGSRTTSGAVLSNTLTANPTPVVTENLKTDSTGTTTGTVSVGSKRTFAITGYINTSHGRVQTTVAQTVNFLNTQTVDVNPNVGPDDPERCAVDHGGFNDDDEQRHPGPDRDEAFLVSVQAELRLQLQRGRLIHADRDFRPAGHRERSAGAERLPAVHKRLQRRGQVDRHASVQPLVQRYGTGRRELVGHLRQQ